MTNKSDIHPGLPGRCRTAVPSQAPSCGSRSWRATNCSPDSAQVDHSHKRNTRKMYKLSDLMLKLGYVIHILYYIILYYSILYYWYYIILYHILLHHIISYYIISYYIILYIILYHIIYYIIFYSILYYIILYHILLYYIYTTYIYILHINVYCI